MNAAHAWKEQASCASIGASLFFGENAEAHGAVWDYKAVRPVCLACPVRRECAVAGIAEPHGMWGGLTPYERRPVRKHVFDSVQLPPTHEPNETLRNYITEQWNHAGSLDNLLREIPSLVMATTHRYGTEID